MTKKCVYPGTFDPITNGHIDVIRQCVRLFDKVVVAVAANYSKNPMFSLEDRIQMAKIALAEFGEKVEVIGFDTLLVDFCKSQKIPTSVRGLRAVSDFEYELQMAYANDSLWSEFETIFIKSTLKNSFISSSIVRSIFSHGGDFSHMVPKGVNDFLKGKKCS